VQRIQWKTRTFASAIAVLALVTVGFAQLGAAAVRAADPGVTDKQITMGYIYSGTGVAASTSQFGGKACEARVDRQNAQGGVNGRKIKLITIDDKSSAANLTAAKDLVTNNNAFVVVDDSAFAFLSYRFLLEQGVPMIGGGYDGDYYGKPGNESIFSALGSPFTGLTSDSSMRIMKQLGTTKSAAVGYGASPSSSASAKSLQDFAAPALGVQPVYTNTTVDFGSSDVGPLVLGMKNAGANGAYLPLVATSNLAIIQGLQQNGVKMKALVMPTGYGQDLLDQPVAKTLGPEDVFTQAWAPVELKTKATKQFQSDLKKYSGLTGVPNFGAYTGYITCELAILGLQNAGSTPTRQGFVDGLRKLGSYDQAGLGCTTVDISAQHYGKYPIDGCGYAVTVKNGKFVPTNGGKPIKSKIVGDPSVVASSTFSASGGSGSSTTTTAAK
jgi:branched-chain amino acid transport system substrate-binding protein